MSIPHDMYRDVQWTPPCDGSRIDMRNPATCEIVDSVPKATDGGLDLALRASRSRMA